MRVKSVKVKINREAMAQLNKAKERALEPVSYTHLDVYKRQNNGKERKGPICSEGYLQGNGDGARGITAP